MTETESPEPSAVAPRRWSVSLLRLWSLRAAPGDLPAEGAARVVLWLGIWSLALWVAFDWWQSQPQPKFSPAGIPLLAWYALAVPGLAALLHRWAAPRSPVAPLLVLTAGLLPILVVLLSAATLFLDPRWLPAVGLAGGIYALMYLHRGLQSLTGIAQRRAAAGAAVCVLAFIATSDLLDVIPDVWNPAEEVASPAAADEKASDATPLDAEAILFEQAARIDAALATVRRDPSADPQAFFVGFAGVGEEQEFAGEIVQAATVLGERYAIGPRRLTLINDRRDLDRVPLATVSGLRYALQGIAARMRVDRDVLFLAISSHGGRDAVIAVANSELPLDDLTDDDLAAALRDSGIQWRVIILSACYAGAFIPSLRDPQTIVITAAASDRSSFGCSNDRDMTYFGEAFYRDALPKARSLRDAFERARAAIAVRERREGVTPSEPQAYFGAKIEAKLAH
jgi:hypothetical protein